MYRKTDPLDAARCLEKAIQHYTAKGNFRRAATQQQNLAEIWEVEVGDSKKAVEAYGVAAEWFESDHAEACVLSRSCSSSFVCFLTFVLFALVVARKPSDRNWSGMSKKDTDARGCA